MTLLVSDDNRKISGMIETLPYVFGSRERHPKLTEEIHITLTPIPKVDILCCSLFYTSHIKLSTGHFTQGVDSSRQNALFFVVVVMRQPMMESQTAVCKRACVNW